MKGLVPKKVSSGNFMHLARVYLFSNASMQVIMQFMKERFKESTSKILCLLEIDKKDILKLVEDDDKVVFFQDPMFRKHTRGMAVFTEIAIPAKIFNDRVVCFKIENDEKKL